MNINEIIVQAVFRVFPGLFGNRFKASLIEIKMEDVMSQSSNWNLKFRSIFILSQQNLRVS